MPSRPSQGNHPQARSLDAAREKLSRGDFGTAKRDLFEIVQKTPRHDEAVYLLGCCCLQLGEPEKGIEYLQRANTLTPNKPAILNTLGVAYSSVGDFTTSEENLRQAISLAPNYADAIANIGLTLQCNGKHDESIKFLSIAARQQNASMRVAEGCINALVRLNLFSQAEAAIQALLPRFPNSSIILSRHAYALALNDEMAEAERVWEQAIRLSEGNPEPYAHRATFRISTGNSAGAEADMEAVFALNPCHPSTVFAWAHSLGREKDRKADAEAMYDRVIGAMAKERLPFDDANNLGFAAGCLADSLGRYDEAFAHYDAANKRVWKRQNIAHEDYTAFSRSLKATFDGTFFEEKRDILMREPQGDDRLGEGLVFIVGMPRSGTTLAEDILIRSGVVMPGGERGDIDELRLKAATADEATLAKLEDLRTLSMDAVRAISAEHHRLVDTHAKSHLIFTDKTPRNFMNLGLIALLFPRAKIIHCMRDPADTCLSCYFNYFAWNSIKFSYDLKALGVFFNTYSDLMRHWQDVLPMTIFELQYEDMVADPHKQIRNLVAFCGLEWDDRHLDTDDTKRTIATASTTQVRKPLYKTSVKRSKPYEKHLSVLLSELEQEGSVTAHS